MSFDPGYNTGWVCWLDGKMVDSGTVRLFGKAKDMTTDLQHLKLLGAGFRCEIEEHKPSEVVLEGVSLWGGSSKSQAAALRGDTFWLAYLVGVYIAICHEFSIQVTVVDVRTWKGSLPLEALQKWVQRQVGTTMSNEHEYCAAGIGLHYFGRM